MIYQDSVTGESSKLYRLDLATGKATLVGSTVPEVADLAFVDRQLYGVAVKPGSQTSQLLNIDTTSGETTVVGNTGFALTGLAYDPVRQNLYGVTAKQLISINPVTGSGRPVMTVADQKHNCGEIAFDPQGNAYITLISAERHKFLATCDLTTGAIRSIGDIGFPNLASMKFYGNTLYGVTGNFFNLGQNGELIQINTSNGKGTLVAISDPIGRWAGFEIYNELPQKTPVSPTPPALVKPSSPGTTPAATPNKPPAAIVPPTSPQPTTPAQKTPVTLGKTPTDAAIRPQQPVSVNLQNISFDSFERNPQQDIVCVAPVRTIIRREEEITLIRKVRKVEQIDVSPACPTNTTQV